jgi:ribose 5-phosphate isomerase B
MKIGITNDHAAAQLKFSIMKYLQDNGYEVVNYGTDGTEAFDYPLAAIPLCKAIQNKEVDLGIAICGTGVGISISCNKHKGIRACCCSDTASARLTRTHNDANVICFGARIVGEELAKDIVHTFVTTPFSNEERHIKRVQQITEIENGQL